MTQTQNVVYTAEKFHSAEQLWFWFLYTRSVQNGFNPIRHHATRRPCEVIDIETMITKLYLAGRINDAQLAVLKEFGDRRRAPHQHIYRENHAAALWRDAMDVIDAAARKHGWID